MRTSELRHASSFMWRLLIIGGVQQGRALRLKTGINRIGRSTENHFQIPDPSVSSVHCEVSLSDVGITVRDLNSTNGTYIEGTAITEAALDPGQILQVGNIELRLEELADPQDLEGVSVPGVAVPPAAVSLTLPDGSLACANHPEVAGAFQCTKCHQALCPACARIVRRISGGQMIFCSLCNGPCEPLFQAGAAEATPAKRGFLGRLAETLKLPFKRQSRK